MPSWLHRMGVKGRELRVPCSHAHIRDFQGRIGCWDARMEKVAKLVFPMVVLKIQPKWGKKWIMSFSSDTRHTKRRSEEGEELAWSMSTNRGLERTHCSSTS